ncbi:MAG: hypothetical protein NTX14_02165 [Candidatus Nealsonbacteria bacterium]|nr:hypothetical protein [Candidatus Nealsonbacteria bacterium]
MRQEATMEVPKLGLEKMSVLLTATPVRIFNAREAEIMSEQPMEINIPGRPVVTGYVILAQNTRNPNPLEVAVNAKTGEFLQSAKGGMEFVLRRGGLSLSGRKSSGAEEQLKGKMTLKELPIRDPDCLTIDGIQFKQTGTISIKLNGGALIKIRE